MSRDEWPVEQDHERIWLEPKCAENAYEGRMWAPDDPWGTCEEPECDAPSVEYVRADLYRQLETPLRQDRRSRRDGRDDEPVHAQPSGLRGDP